MGCQGLKPGLCAFLIITKMYFQTDLQGSFCNAAITYLHTSVSIVTLEEASPFTGRIDPNYFLGSTVYKLISYRLI